MKINPPNAYYLDPALDSGFGRTSHQTGKSNFEYPDTVPCQKLYVVMEGQDFHYVGITNTSIATRLRTGLKASGKAGYHGYKWKSHSTQLTLLVWSFPHKKKEFRLQLETIEAETVYLIRSRTGNWPLSQNEIHFHPSNIIERSAANTIYRLSLADRTPRLYNDV